MPKILMLSDITGLGPDYHVGDEAMAEVAIQRLDKLIGKENLILGCANPTQVPETYGVKAFPFYHVTNDHFRRMLWRRPFSYLKSIAMNIYQVWRCDKILLCGGGNMTSVWPEVLEARLRILRTAILFRKEIILVSQTMGPYTNSHLECVNRIMQKATWIGVRDINFSRAQVSATVHFALDDACYLEGKHSEYTRSISNKNKDFACIAMRKFGDMDDSDVLRVASSIERTIQKRGLNTVFIPHHAPKGTKGDIKLANDIKHLWAAKAFHVVNPIPRASELKALTSESKLVVSMRYHQLIFALSIGVPAVGIYVDEYTRAKLTGSFESFGLKPLLTSIYAVEGNLEALVVEACNMRGEFQAAASKIQKEKSISERPYRMLAGLAEDDCTDSSDNAIEAEGA